MNISLKNLIGQIVYNNESNVPWGRIKGVRFTDRGDRISSVTVETLSLIPLCRTFPLKEISDLGDKRLVLQPEISVDCKSNGVMDNKISGVVHQNNKFSKIRDMRFDSETGEITDVVIGKGAFRKGKKICVNKMHINDNIIYIE